MLTTCNCNQVVPTRRGGLHGRTQSRTWGAAEAGYLRLIGCQSVIRHLSLVHWALHTIAVYDDWMETDQTAGNRLEMKMNPQFLYRLSGQTLSVVAAGQQAACRSIPPHTQLSIVDTLTHWQAASAQPHSLRSKLNRYLDRVHTQQASATTSHCLPGRHAPCTPGAGVAIAQS